MSKLIVVIDGECQFCQFSARVLRKMIARDICYLNQQDVRVAELAKQFPSDVWALESIKLLKGDQVFAKSEALAHLMGDAQIMYQPFRIIFFLPKRVLDRGYDWVARNRYFWNKNCSIT